MGCTQVAHQHAIRLSGQYVLEIPRLVRFHDAHGGYPDLGVCMVFMYIFSHLCITADILEIKVDTLDARLRSGHGLCGIAAEYGEFVALGRGQSREAVAPALPGNAGALAAAFPGKFFDQLAAHFVEQGNGEHEPGFELIGALAQREAGAPHAGELGLDAFRRERAFFGRFEWLAAAHGDTAAGGGELASHASIKMDIECLSRGSGGVAPEVAPGGVQVLIQRRIGGFPEQLTGFDKAPVDAAALAVKIESRSLHLPDTAALFLVAVLSGIHHKSIAGGNRYGGQGIELHPALATADDASGECAALLAESAVGEQRVVGAIEPAGGEAAGERHLHGVEMAASLFWQQGDSRQGGIYCAAVGAGSGGHVFRALEPAFNLEAVYSGGKHLRHTIQRAEILRGKDVAAFAQVAEPAVDFEFVGHAAGLGAFTAIGAALPQGFAGEALAGVGHAEGPVAENLDRFGRGFGAGFNFAQGEFARENNLLRIKELIYQAYSLRAAHGHLGGDMQLNAPAPGFAMLGNEGSQPHILHNHAIDPGGIQSIQIVHRLLEFAREDEHVHGHIAAHAVAMQEGHEGTQIFSGKIICAHARVELVEPEVNGICSIGNSGACAIPIACRCKYFRLLLHGVYCQLFQAMLRMRARSKSAGQMVTFTLSPGLMISSRCASLLCTKATVLLPLGRVAWKAVGAKRSQMVQTQSIYWEGYCWFMGVSEQGTENGAGGSGCFIDGVYGAGLFGIALLSLAFVFGIRGGFLLCGVFFRGEQGVEEPGGSAYRHFGDRLAQTASHQGGNADAEVFLRVILTQR